MEIENKLDEFWFIEVGLKIKKGQIIFETIKRKHNSINWKRLGDYLDKFIKWRFDF